MKSVEKFLKYGSFFLVFLAPLVFWEHRLFPHISSKTFFIQGVIEILFFAWLYLVAINPAYRLNRKALFYFLPAILFVGWMTLSGLLSSNFGLSFWSSLGRGTGLLFIYHVLAFSFVIASLVKIHGQKYVNDLFQWIVAGSFVLALSVWFGVDGFKSSLRVLETDAGGGFAGNSTLTAGYLLFSLFISAFLLFSREINTRFKWFFGSIIFVTIFSPVFLSLYSFFSGNGILGSARGTILALATGVASVVLGYLFLSSKKYIKILGIGLFGAGLIVFGILWSQLLNPNTNLHQKFADQARSTRFIFWDVSEKAIQKSPVFGYGSENFSLAFQEFFNPQVLVLENSFEGWVDRAHNIYYDLGVSGGYPLIVFYLMFLASLFYAIYVAHKKGYFTRIQASIFAGMLVAYVANLLFTFESTLSLLALFVFSGILYSFSSKSDKGNSLSSGGKDFKWDKNILLALLVIFLIITWIFFAYKPSQKSKIYAETFAAGVNNRPEMYQDLLKGSRVGSHWDISGLAFETYRKYAASPSLIKSDKEKLPYHIKNIEALLEHLYKVAENNKTNYRLYITIVYLENTLTYLIDRPYSKEVEDKILSAWEKAKELSPTNPNVFWTLAQLEIWGGDFDGTEKAYREAIAIDPTFAASHRLFVNFAKVIGNQNLFDEAMAQARKYIPEFVFE